MVNKLTTISRYFLNTLLAAVLVILILNLFFWGFTWLLEKPFEPLGWLRMIIDLFDYSRCHIRMDYVMQSLLLLCLLALPTALIVAMTAVLNSRG